MEEALHNELPLLKHLREKLQDLELCEETLSDMNLIRWLRARNLNIIEAEKMFRKHLEWYEDERMDTVLSYEPPKTVRESFPYRCCGYDKQGSPIFTMDSKDWENFPQLLKIYSKEDIIRYYLKLFEICGYMMRRQSQINNLNYLTQYVGVCDLSGLSWKLITSIECTSVLLTLGRYVEQNYPETLKTMYLVNAPRMFSFAWGIFRPIISDKSASKFRVYGYNREEWTKEILNMASEDQMIKQYGGILSNDTDIMLQAEDVVPRNKGSY